MTAQLARYALVGATNTLLSLVAYTLLTAAAVPSPAAATAAFALGAANGYALNRRWTFAAGDTRRSRAVYVWIQAAGALATALLVWLAVHESDAGRVAAYLVAVPPVTAATFLANRTWTFAARN
jgi:putative flippase GtrA